MKIIFICPYFGKLPNYFQLWLNSCEHNPSFNWMIITDDPTPYKYPKNVSLVSWSFNELKDYIQRKYNFKINLFSPYKLCDFKPAYGYIFAEFLEDYDFWGHCDLDCIMGDLQKFFTDKILEKYDKILFLGHMTLYKNNYYVNNRYELTPASGISYKKIFSDNKNYAFDELNSSSINTIYLNNNYSIYNKSIYSDISPMYFRFILSKYDNKYNHYYEKNVRQIFLWDNGVLYRFYIFKNKVFKEEVSYVHFQKRKMVVNNNMPQRFLIVPNEFINCDKEIGKVDILKYSKNNFFYIVYFQQKFKALKWHISNIKLKLLCDNNKRN